MGWKQISYGVVMVSALGVQPALAASPVVAAAETSIYLDAGFMHTQYHENIQPGDDESGFTPGFGVGASALLPTHPGNPGSVDLYTALNYDFDAGDIKYGGHFLFSGKPLTATDNAVFNRIEARIGVGFPLIGGGESIPFFAGGYQAWNRNINQNGAIGTDEFYHSGLFGAGWKLDIPFARTFVASASGEVLALAGGGITSNVQGATVNPGGFGITPEERVEFSVDDAVSGRFHMFVKTFWEHFTYSGTHPESFSEFYEPLSTTTQFGANVGVGYSFN